jgi:DNA polymerase-3 subunit gamma/tau
MSDDSGSGLFGDGPAPGGGDGYLVLARKYRPRTFEDLIGQEAMVRTIANSFRLGRIPQAYMMTGVRGVGKTTTARLIARALNYESDTVRGPSIQLDPPGRHCARIMASNHPDVFEMDAASRTGINDIREILDSVRYAPVMARMKVYIIDEVHMLSTAAFNGLLKTLEEPPEHVVFIFATTEIRKVPVTVLSRCQRFDLKRVEPHRLAEHLQAICAKEGAAVEPDGLGLIAKAADGSVRDALSLLDQAIVQRDAAGGAVTAGDIRVMLGLADRGRSADLFAALLRGETGAALTELRAQYDAGADPALIVRDLMDIAHEAARVQALGDGAVLVGGADWANRIRTIANGGSPAQLSRLWQMLLRAYEDAGRAPDPLGAVEMAVVRLAAAASLPPPEDAARLLRGEATASGAAGAGAPVGGNGPAAASVGPAPIASFADLMALFERARAIDLQIDVERFVRLARFGPGEIVFASGPGMPEDLPRRLQRYLLETTGEDWSVEADAPEGEDSLAERRERERQRKLAEIAAHPFVKSALDAFPNAQITAVRNGEGDPSDGGEVVPFPSAPTAAPPGARARTAKDRRDP